MSEATNTGRKPFELDWESVDNITKANLVEIYQEIHKDLYDHEVNGNFMHPDDIVWRKETLPALKTVLRYFGEKIEG